MPFTASTVSATILLSVFTHGAYGARATLQISSPATGGLITFSSGAVLAWNHHAHIQLKLPSGQWAPEVRLEADFVESATPSPAGALLLADLVQPAGGTLSTSIFSIDSTGKVTKLLLPPKTVVTSIALSGNRNWISAQDGVFELKPDGRLSERLEAEPSAIILGSPSGPPVVCVRRDLSMAHYRPPYCHSTGSSKWKAVGKWIEDPVTCGEFIVEHETGRLTIRAMSDGRVVSSRAIGQQPAISCGGDSDLLVGANSITDFSLPQMAVRWTERPKISPITALASTKDNIVVFSAHGSYDMTPPRSVSQ
jgi:hypothetical protein